MNTNLKALRESVDNLNKQFTTKSRHEFILSGAYGGWQVCLTGKSKKVRGRWVWYGMGSGQADVTYGYCSAKEVLAQLGVLLSIKDYMKDLVKRYDKTYK